MMTDPIVLEEGRIYKIRNEPTIEEMADELITQYYAHEKWERERRKDGHTERCRIRCSLEYLIGAYVNERGDA